MEIYVRELDEEKVYSTTNWLLSTYFPYYVKIGFNVFIKTFPHNVKNYYLLGIQYDEGDVQIEVTGTLERNESPIKGMGRELAEEVGLLPEKLRFVSKVEKGFHNQIMYSVNILDTKTVSKSQHWKNHSKNYDIRSKKVGCFVYGTKKDMLAFLSKPDIYRYYSKDKIKSICCISLIDAITIHNKRNKPHLKLKVF